MPRIEAVQTLLRGLESAPTNSSVTIQMHLAKRLESYIQDEDHVTIHFQDGSTASADILVGADGIGSRTRQTMCRALADDIRDTDPERALQFENGISPVFTGTYQYRALLDADKLRQLDPTNVALKVVSMVSCDDRYVKLCLIPD